MSSAVSVRKPDESADSGWVGRSLLAGHVALRHGALFDGKQRRAGVAVEHEELRGLGSLQHRVLAVRQRDQRRRRGIVVVPQIVMHGLEVPDEFSGRGAQRHDGIGIAVVAEPRDAVVVDRRAAGGQEHQVALRIRGNDGPGVGAAAANARLPFQVRYAGSCGSCGTGFQVQRSAPLRTSKARTSPLAPTVELLSAIAEPTTMRSLTMAGGDVCSYSSP